MCSINRRILPYYPICILVFLTRSKTVGKSRKKSVGRRKCRFARRCRNKNVGCIISKSATRLKRIKEDARRFLFINRNVKKCQKRSVKPHTPKDVKQIINKSEHTKIPTNAYGLQKSQINIAHKKQSSFKTKLYFNEQRFMFVIVQCFSLTPFDGPEISAIYRTKENQINTIRCVMT